MKYYYKLLRETGGAKHALAHPPSICAYGLVSPNYKQSPLFYSYYQSLSPPITVSTLHIFRTVCYLQNIICKYNKGYYIEINKINSYEFCPKFYLAGNLIYF